MKQEIIDEGNFIIADFMDIEPMKWKSEYDGSDMMIWVDKEKKMTVYDEPELHYHTSWNWLMPVVEKIEKGFDGRLFHSTIDSMFSWDAESESYFVVHSCYIAENSRTVFESKEHREKINAVYEAVVQFITWYNSQIK